MSRRFVCGDDMLYEITPSCTLICIWYTSIHSPLLIPTHPIHYIPSIPHTLCLIPHSQYTISYHPTHSPGAEGREPGH
ncbi:hypothetical protein EON63_01610 [archaeon]|nr:MAG: hypothetical protein EON63_01610 [archaeon]